MIKVEPDSLENSCAFYSPNDDPLIGIKQERIDVTLTENVAKVSYSSGSVCCY
jgi:hypothetical protein